MKLWKLRTQDDIQLEEERDRKHQRDKTEMQKLQNVDMALMDADGYNFATFPLLRFGNANGDLTYTAMRKSIKRSLSII